jgi:hypothetical protein
MGSRSDAMRRYSPAASTLLGLFSTALDAVSKARSISPRFHSFTDSAVSLAVFAAFSLALSMSALEIVTTNVPSPRPTTRSLLSRTSTAAVYRPTASAATLT